MVTDQSLDLIEELAGLTDVLNQLAGHEIALAKDASDRCSFPEAFTHAGRADGIAEASTEIARHLTRWLRHKKASA